MKYCENCGKELNDNQKFCDKCGTKVVSEDGTVGVFDEPKESSSAFVQRNYEQVNSQSFETSKQSNQFQMKWFKFLIYFGLFAGAVVNLGMAGNYMSGLIYEQQIPNVTAEMVYAQFGGLKILDIIYGIILLGFAAFAIYTRFRLAKYKKDGPMCLYIMYGGSTVISILYLICASAVTGINMFTGQGLGSLILSGVMIAVNYTYFNKRKELFVR